MIEGLFSPSFFAKGLRFPNYEVINKLSEKDFRDFYIGQMREYKLKDGWWQPDKIPSCTDCRLVIPAPEQLRRFCGQSLHPDCFRKMWENERREYKDKKDQQRYFDRVANID